MGSDDVLLRPNGIQLNGLLPNREASVTRKLDLHRWAIAEDRAAELISHIQLDNPSWEHRNAIASYVQRLISQCISSVVFSYGSVPLKTYLPDGDIDLTVFSQDQSFNNNWATEVRDILEKEEKNENGEYCVREVQLINAEVKLVKCLVNSIVVDISFGQLSGLCTLCFLEEVDRHIGQNHLFKRSIILIKAWCYYESRLLGAYHGLISTYALETLILYIFRVFNSSFAGPLEVLYRFLEFFSKFDWDNFCISLLGPVPIGSLPDMTVDLPQPNGDALLLNRTFLHNCSICFSVRPSTHVKEQFATKHLNIIDFLRTSNNLGRSVSKGNFFRIRSAFSFGAQRLAGLLDCSKECVVADLNHFFVNTWERNGKIHRPDTLISPPFDPGQEEQEHVPQKKNIKQTNIVANGNHISLNGGEKVRRSEFFQDKVQYGHQYGRTCSSPELMNSRSKLVHETISNKERGRQQNSISESDRGGKTGIYSVVRGTIVNAVDSSTRGTSPSESYDGDDDSASISSRCGEDTSSRVVPVQNSAKMIHSPWVPTLGRQFVGFPLPEARLNLNFYYPHGPPAPESGNNHAENNGSWEQNAENGSHSDKSLEDSLRAVTIMDHNTVDDNGSKNGVQFSDAEATFPSFPHAEALQFPNWPVLYPWPVSGNKYPPFPVAFLPATSTDPYASIPQYSTYTCPFKGDKDNISSDGDILTGDIDGYLSNMQYGRSCQSVNLQGPLFYCPPMVPPHFLQGPFMLGDPGRPPVSPEMHASYDHHNQRSLKSGCQYYPKGVSGNGTGTGTYFPNPRNAREFQAPNFRYNNRGNYRNNRKEQHREREVNSNFNPRPRFVSRGRKPNPSFDRSGGRNNGAPLQWEAYDNYSQPTYHQSDPTYMVYSNETNSGNGSQDHPPDYANSSPDQPSSPTRKGKF